MNSGAAGPIRSATLAFGLLLASFASEVLSQDLRYRDGRFLETVGSVTIQRADEASADEAVLNMPFLQGDRVWTDDSSRAEIVFAEGEILWIGERSKLESLGRDGRERDERLGLRVFAGSFGARVRPGGPGFEFQAPGGRITTTGAAAFRVDVRDGETVVTVGEGEILADLAGQRISLRGGERVRFAGNAVSGPFPHRRTNPDPFDRWCEERFEELSRWAESQRDDERLPDELDPYAGELERNGEWVYEEPQGYVYVPRVAHDWAPYTYGRWVFTLYGWTWVDSEPWGFVTSHYGRWGYSANIGWHWMPRVGFSGAWVSWSSPLGSWGNTIGWCALGYNDRPVGSFSYGSGGRAVARGDSRSAAGRGWSFANRSDLGRASIHRRRVDLPVEEAERAVVWSPGTAPDREFRETRRGTGRAWGEEGRSGGAATGARIQVRPTPGDSLPELRSDPMTTIPTPESRRGKTIGQDGFKEEQERKSRPRGDDWGVSGEVWVSPSTSDPARPRKNDRPPAEPQASPTGATRDPLLSRFFRSITGSGADREPSRDADAARSNDGSARRRESPARDDAAARESNPRERPRPAEAKPVEGNRERPKPTGVERSEPRKPPPPPASPRGGSPDDRGAKRKPDPGP